MNVLEKILEEVEAHAIEFESFGMCDDYVSVGWIKEIIRSHMDEVDDDWIPVEERLPEEETGELIITDKRGNVYMNITYGYAEETDREPTFHRWDEEYWNCYKYDVTAWRRKPKPYKAD